MKPVAPYKARNYYTLKCLGANSPEIGPYISEIFAAYKDYVAKAGNPALINPLAGDELKKIIIKDVLEECYARTRVRDGLRWISDYRTNHGHASCPMCGAMHAKSIDHYLPQHHYPEFSVFSLNLVPSCIICNQHRSASANAAGAQLRMLHPFFEGEDMGFGFLFAVNIGTYEVPEFLPSAYHRNRALLPRIGEHIRRSVDIGLFQTWLLDRWGHLRLLAARKNSLVSLSEELHILLNDEERLTGPNNWNAALLRGVLMDPDAMQWLVDNPMVIA